MRSDNQYGFVLPLASKSEGMTPENLANAAAIAGGGGMPTLLYSVVPKPGESPDAPHDFEFLSLVVVVNADQFAMLRPPMAPGEMTISDVAKTLREIREFVLTGATPETTASVLAKFADRIEASAKPTA